MFYRLSDMIYLVPFTNSYARSICSWINSEEDVVLFAGPLVFRYPLTEEQFEPYLREPGRRVFAALDNYTDVLIGMGEIFTLSENTVKLCRILVNDAYRGQGMGQSLTLALLQQAFADPHVQRVELNVYDFNTAAIRCYEQCGFRPDETDTINPGNWNHRRGIRMVTTRQNG